MKLLALRCAGFNNVDVAAASELGLVVVRVPAYSPHAVAEHAVALLLTLNRKIHRAFNRVRELNFSLSGLVGFDLHGKTIGIVGFSRDSHNRRFGQMLAAGKRMAQNEKEMRWLPRACGRQRPCALLPVPGRVPAPLAEWVRRLLAGSPPSLDGLLQAMRAAPRPVRRHSSSTASRMAIKALWK